jgi:hypothetical protein
MASIPLWKSLKNVRKSLAWLYFSELVEMIYTFFGNLKMALHAGRRGKCTSTFHFRACSCRVLFVDWTLWVPRIPSVISSG